MSYDIVRLSPYILGGSIGGQRGTMLTVYYLLSARPEGVVRGEESSGDRVLLHFVLGGRVRLSLCVRNLASTVD